MIGVWSLKDKWAEKTNVFRSFQGCEPKATERPQLLNLHHRSVEGFFFNSNIFIGVKFW